MILRSHCRGSVGKRPDSVAGFDLLTGVYHSKSTLTPSKCLDNALISDESPAGVMGSGKELLLVNQAGMLEMLARTVQME